MNLEDYRIYASPSEPPASNVESINRSLVERFGRASTGEPWFRIVAGWSETILFNGRRVMKYPDRVRKADLEVVYEVTTDEGPVEVTSPDPRDWPDDLQAYAHKLVLPVTYYRQHGDPYFYLEGFIAGGRAQMGHDAAFERPTSGKYEAIYRLEGDRGEMRLPGEMDVERIASLVRKQQESPLYRNDRWDGEYDADRARRAIEHDQRIEAESERLRTEQTYANVEYWVNDYLRRNGRIYSLPN